VSQSAGRILLVEDEEALAESIRYSLDREGYAVTVAQDGRRAVERFHDSDPELVILDLMLPELPGLDVVRMIRQESTVPIIVVTAKDSEADKVTGLELGADDYVTKPFSVRELVSRVRALLRRAGQRGHGSRLYVGDVALDPVTRRVYRGDRELALTQREFALLEYFMKNAGKPLSRALIAEQVWRQTPVDGGETNIVDVYVAYLRKKLDTPDDAPMLQTVRGIGYVLRPPKPREN